MFREYGEEPYSKEAAKAIVRYRNRGEKYISTTFELRDCISPVLRKWKGKKRKGMHPATMCFQVFVVE